MAWAMVTLAGTPVWSADCTAASAIDAMNCSWGVLPSTGNLCAGALDDRRDLVGVVTGGAWTVSARPMGREHDLCGSGR